MKVMGLDLSLSASGVAFIGDDGDAWVTTVKSEPTGNHPTLMTRRIVRIRNQILTLVRECSPDYVLLERGAIGGTMSGAILERAGLWFHVSHGLDSMGIPIAAAAPATLKKFATDNGQASKAQVITAVTRMFPDVELGKNDNEADALAAAAAIAVRARHEHLPFVAAEWRRAAIAQKVAWPPELQWRTPPAVSL